MPTDTAGSLFLAAMLDAYDFEPREHTLLTSAAATLDELEAMEAALAESGPLVRGSTGQDRVNPLIPALANHRLALLRILKDIGVEPDALPVQTPAQRRASEHAQHAAQVRWAKAAG